VVDTSLERRKKKRRDRRKTNSESSSTKVEIPQFSVNDEVEITKPYNNCEDISSDKKVLRQVETKCSENKEVQEDTSKEVKRRNKNKGKQISDEATDANIISVTSKPKVVVPSPPGIPRPKPINRKETNRDSMISDDGFFLEDNLKSERTGSVEETEEFKKAVESFDQIYLLESGNHSPDISSNRSSGAHTNKLVASAEDSKADLSPNTKWKKLKTGKCADASESIENENQSTEVRKTEMRSETKNGNEKISTKHIKQEKSFEEEVIMQCDTSESQYQNNQFSTVEQKKSSSKILQKETSIDISESSESRSYMSEKIEKQESREIIENNRKNEEQKSESSSQSSKSSKSSKKNKKNRKSNDITEKSISDEIKMQEDNFSTQVAQSSQVMKTESKQMKQSKSFDKSEEILIHQTQPEPTTQSTEQVSTHCEVKTSSKEQNKSSKRNKKGKSMDLQINESESIPVNSKAENENKVQSKESSKRDKKGSSKKNKNNKQDIVTEVEDVSIPVSQERQFTNDNINENEILFNKTENEEYLNNQGKGEKEDINQSRKISILGQNYSDSKVNENVANDFHETFTQENTSMKKESRGFLSDEEREELEKENALVKAIREFQAQSSNESTHSEVSSQILSDGDFSQDVQYSQLEKQIIKKSMDAQETIKTALEDIENTNSKPLQRRTQDEENILHDFENTETVRIQKHSLSIQDGVLIEQTTTERFSHPIGCLDSQEDSCTIDPDSLKNVDGPAKQRKGSSRFSKRQGSKSKSPGFGNQSSFSGPDDREDEEETSNNTDLTTRLEETNVRMKKLSEVFNVMCDDPRVEPNQDIDQDDVVQTEQHYFEKEERQTSFHPLTRTTQIIRKECPLDEVIGSMIQKPENLSSSSQFSSSVENNPSSPVMYRAVVTQRHEEKEEFQEEDLL